MKKIKILLFTTALCISTAFTSFAEINHERKVGNIHVPANGLLSHTWNFNEPCGNPNRRGAMVFFKSLADYKSESVRIAAPGITLKTALGWEYCTSYSGSGASSQNVFTNIPVPAGTKIIVMADKCSEWWHIGGSYYEALWPVTTTFNANGGKFSNGSGTTSVSGYTDTAISVSPPTRPGYKFLGWSTSSSATSGSTKPNYISGTYYAVWKLDNVSITFNPNGGSGGPGTVSLQIGSKYTPSSPTRSGYSFKGWYTAASGGTKWNNTVPSTATTYYAQWTPIKYNITFNANGGTGGPGTVSLQVGTTYNASSPSRNGYTFEGWYTSASGGSKWNNVVPNGATTYYAHWKAITYKISYNGVQSGYTGPTSYNVESAAITLPAPVKTDHQFVGFTGTGLSSPTISVVIPKGSTGDRTYTATWNELPPVIETHPNDEDVIEYTGLSESDYKKEHTSAEIQLEYGYETVSFSVTAIGGSSSGSTNVYTWQYSTDGNNWTNITDDILGKPVDQNKNTLTIKQVSRELDKLKIRCAISNQSGTTIYSNSATLDVYYLPSIYMINVENGK